MPNVSNFLFSSNIHANASFNRLSSYWLVLLINSVIEKFLSKQIPRFMFWFVKLFFHSGESMDIDGMVALLEYRDIEGDSVPILMCFKHGLEEEKF